MSWVFRENSLDAIRLFAASQVAVLHVWEFMYPSATGNWFFELIRLFPGVPIFFFISGYLISKSYERAPSINEYAKNRALRLYPALIICVGVNLAMVASTGYLSAQNAGWSDVGLLFLAKSTFIQFYNPDFMRAFGDGVLNGSLWTICVELQFYFLVPLLYFLFGSRTESRTISNRTLILLIVVFLIANRALFILREDYSDWIIWKLYRVSFAPWIYMFLVGVLVQRNFDLIKEHVAKIPPWAAIFGYVLIAYFGVLHFGLETGNSISPILFAFLVPVIIRFAYAQPQSVNKIMKGNDISYGIYIWHMPFVNQMLYWNLNESHFYAWITLLVTVVVAVLSWWLIEKPALKLKNYSLNSRLFKRA